MGLIDPKTSFEFDVLAKGPVRVEVKEAGIDAPKGGKKSGKCYWVKVVAVGGDQEGVSHREYFYEITKDDFSFSKMAGFLYKLGVIKTLGKIDTAIFLTPDFENRWKNGMISKRMGLKIRHGYAEDDKEKNNPRSESTEYYSDDEIVAILNKGKVVPMTNTPINQTPAAPAAPAPWA